MTKPIAAHNSVAIKRLIKEGIIPPQCRSFTLVVETTKAITMKLEVFVTREQMDAIAAALADNPEEAKRIGREVIFMERVSGKKAGIKL